MTTPIQVNVSVNVEKATTLKFGYGDVLISTFGVDGEWARMLMRPRPADVPNQGIGGVQDFRNVTTPQPGDILLQFDNVESLDTVIQYLGKCREWLEPKTTTEGRTKKTASRKTPTKKAPKR